MAETLKEKRIVFITGTPEYGKTFTAVRLMREFYNRGYEPRWIKGGEPAERIEVRKRLENIRAELKPRNIVYFEDPFGRTKYERREGLEREIGTIIDTVKQVEEVYVIVTSREEVFKEFEKEKLSAKDLKEFEKKLNVKKSSYDAGKRKEILLNWAEEENCKWVGNEELKELVLESIKDEKILPTPLSIKDFAVATFDIEKEDELKEKIKEKSKETAKAFAEEIKNMSDDKILFLSFPFISDYFEVEFVRETYQELVKELDLKNAWEFDRVLNWFKDDKITFGYLGIAFSHPSYSEALPYLLAEDGYITQLNKRIFSKLMLKLAEKDDDARRVARAVAGYLHMLPENVRNELMLKLAEKDDAAWHVAEAVARYFHILPENVRNLLFKLSEKDAAAGYVAEAVARYFHILPENVRNLLFKLAEKDDAAKDVAWAVKCYFNMLPENVRNELLFKLSEKDAAARHVAEAVARYFHVLPDAVRNELLLKLAEKEDDAAEDVAEAVAANYDKLPENVRNLLFELSEKDTTAVDVAVGEVRNYNELPKDVRNLLFKLSEPAGHVGWVVDNKFDKLPEDVRNELLLKVSENLDYGGVAWWVASIVGKKFDKLPEDVRNKLLLKVSENLDDEKVAWYVARIAKNKFDKLPEDVRNELLLKVSEKGMAAWQVAKPWALKGVAWHVAKCVAHNYDKLPADVRNLLDRLQKPLQQVIEDLSKRKKRRHKEQALDLISNTFPKLNRDFVLKILNELSECEHETVRIKAAKMLNDIFGDSEGKKEY
jgi:hypothetical protein